MKYSEFKYLWPTRPEEPVAPDSLDGYEMDGWVAQYKKNGTCNTLYVSPDKDVICKTRHKDQNDGNHKQWSPSEESSAPFKELPGDGWYVFQTELLHNKVKGDVKDTHYIVDILVHDGEYLTKKTFVERMDILLMMFDFISRDYSHYVISDKVWLALTITEDFHTKWKECASVAASSNGAPMDEGLVLKNPNAKLKIPLRQNSNTKWMQKCRVKSANYTF